jgi:hypothetical protein
MLSESHRATRQHELLRVFLTTLARRASKSSIDPSQLPALPAHLTMVAMLFDEGFKTFDIFNLLQQLVASNAAESRTLEFKQDLQIATDDQKRELLSDVTAFGKLRWRRSRHRNSR